MRIKDRVKGKRGGQNGVSLEIQINFDTIYHLIINRWKPIQCWHNAHCQLFTYRSCLRFTICWFQFQSRAFLLVFIIFEQKRKSYFVKLTRWIQMNRSQPIQISRHCYGVNIKLTHQYRAIHR